jgi:Icc-related predicted phosphoesterase
MIQQPEREITICLFSDTHELHREVEMPRASLYLCSGDFTMFSRDVSSVRDFNSWLADLGAPVVLIPGNHESFIEAHPSERSLLSNATVLINESVEIAGGLKIWGSPVTPLSNTAFGMPSPDERRRLYNTIPDDTDILITHGPPFEILDRAPGSRYHAGCPELLEAVQRVQPMLHVFGYVHGAYGTEELDGTLYLNAALLSQYGDVERKPVVVRIKAK